jgi:hypothetical protein
LKINTISIPKENELSVNKILIHQEKEKDLLLANFVSSDNEPNYDLILIKDLNFMKYNLDDDIDSIWEALNSRLHKKFGYGEEIKKSAVSNDLNWTYKTLSAYINWDRMKNLHQMLEFWLRKVKRQLKKSSLTSAIQYSAEESREESLNEKLNTNEIAITKEEIGKY